MANNPTNNTYQALRDQNRIPVAMGQSNADSSVSMPFLIDHVTGRVLTDSTATLSATWYNETPAGTINGSNTVFTLTNTPAANSLVLTLARQPQILTTDYTISGNTITFVAAPDASLSGQPFNAIYATSGGVITGTVYSETPTGLINGVNTSYIVLHTITTVIGMELNGQYIDPSQYTVSGAGFTMGTAIPAAFSGLPFTIIYV